MAETAGGARAPEEAPEAREWWEAARSRRLLVQECRACGGRQHYPRAMCVRCGAVDLGWVEAAGGGTIYSFTHSHRSPDPGRFQPPYTIALVTLDEGPRLLTAVAGDGIRCGARVRLEWRSSDDGPPLPVFRTEAAEPAEPDEN